jgi:ElaB/YqjD/DUF883 family membrane-anchored ribosome-binding protein
MRSSEEQSDTSAEEGRKVSKRRRSAAASSEPARLLSALDEARQSVSDAAADLEDRVQQHPWRMLGLAVGAGYILGGGLFSALTGRLLLGGLRIGMRVAALPLVREELLGALGSLTENGRGETERRQQ